MNILPDLFAIISYFGLVDDPCFLQQVVLQRQADTVHITLTNMTIYDANSGSVEHKQRPWNNVIVINHFKDF